MMQSSEMQANGRRWRWLQNPCLVSPSLMGADLLRLGEDIKALEVAGADALHVDVMDGHYVDNLALGYDLLKQVRDATHLPIDVHLMVEFLPQVLIYVSFTVRQHARLCDFCGRSMPPVLLLALLLILRPQWSP